jgi:hypothetical protein
VQLQTHSSPAAEGRSPPPVRCTTVKKSKYRHILAVTVNFLQLQLHSRTQGLMSMWVEVGSSRRSLRCGMRFTLPRPGAGPMTRASHAFQSRNRICRSYLQRPCTRLHPYLHGPACQLFDSIFPFAINSLNQALLRLSAFWGCFFKFAANRR